MRKLIYYFALLAITLSFVESKAQNTLLLVTGKKIEIGEFKVGDSLFLAYKNKKGKIRSANLQDVFSVKKKNGEETIFYIPDSTDNETFTINQMRDFVNGAYDARTNYKTPWVTTGGFVVGGGSAVAVSVIGLNSLLVPIFPALYSGGVGIVKVKKNKLDIPENLKSNNYYVEGYTRVANHKRINNAIIGSGVGIAIGILGIIIFNK
ncbi:MAG: hypothetical protein ABFS35_10700 [Bacteroidota bacterium]